MTVLLVQSANLSANDYEFKYPDACATCPERGVDRNATEIQNDEQSSQYETNNKKSQAQADEDLKAYRKNREIQEQEARKEEARKEEARRI